MISVDEARTIIRNAVSFTENITVRIEDAENMVLAESVIANHAQPPFDASAMDGYACQSADLSNPNTELSLIGISAAGKAYDGCLGAGETVRIFTGAPVPKGADCVVIQENTERRDNTVIVKTTSTPGQNIRKTGVDFDKNDTLVPKNEILTGRALIVAAAGNNATVTVRRRPKIALLANGDELVPVGGRRNKDQIICSIPYGLAPLIRHWGGCPVFCGIARDDPDDIEAKVKAVDGADIIVPIGGASVGDKDYMRSVFKTLGFTTLFEKVAVKPGKPTWFGKMKNSIVLGLPGNPASALVTSYLFLHPAINALIGKSNDSTLPLLTARTKAPISSNGDRETYLRGSLSTDNSGNRVVLASERQDSSLTSVFALSNVLIRREKNAIAVSIGEQVEILPL
ncbi:MAG: gephyrin-like molybdotransferase Glp [Pseudomonadota bacterium]